MRLSLAAKKELEDILRRELGEEGFRPFDDVAIHDLGSRLLRLTALVLKRERHEELGVEDEPPGERVGEVTSPFWMPIKL